MRFTLYLIALLSTTEIFAQSFCDSTLMNYGTQEPRNEIVVYDKENARENLFRALSRYVLTLEEWTHPSGNERIFESRFTRPFSWIGRQLFIKIASASSPYVVSVNGEEIARVENCSLGAEINITKPSREGRNVVTITLLDEHKTAAIDGWQHDPKPSIGEVYVMTQPTQMLRDISVRTSLVGEKLYSHVSLIIKSYALSQRTSTIHYAIYRANGEMVSFGSRDITLSMRGEDTLTFAVTTPRSEGWSADSPELFTLKVKSQFEGRYLEYHSYDIGFRSVEVDAQEGGLKINGNPTTLKCKEVGGDLDPSQIKSIKSEGYNTIRIAAGVVNPNIYSAADRHGVYVVAPIAINSSTAEESIARGANPTNDPRWWGAYMQRVDYGYHTVALHPSVVAFSLAESSLNGYNLYEAYLRLKSKGDSRPVIYMDAQGEWNTDNVELKP